MAVDEQLVRFTPDDRRPLVDAMAELAARGDGEGWVNLSPVVSDEDQMRLPERSGLAGWFSARGPAVPVATWMPAVVEGRVRPAQIGLAHGTGPNALPRLADEGVSLPADWTKRQDHAKHGVVADLPAAVELDAVVAWLVAAAARLSPVDAVGGRWEAVVHRPR